MLINVNCREILMSVIFFSEAKLMASFVSRMFPENYLEKFVVK